MATFEDQLPLTPDGRPLNIAPVAPVVAYVMLAIDVPTHKLWPSLPTPEFNAIVLFGLTVIVPVAVFVPPVHPPVIVTV